MNWKLRFSGLVGLLAGTTMVFSFFTETHFESPVVSINLARSALSVNVIAPSSPDYLSNGYYINLFNSQSRSQPYAPSVGFQKLTNIHGNGPQYYYLLIPHWLINLVAWTPFLVLCRKYRRNHGGQLVGHLSERSAAARVIRIVNGGVVGILIAISAIFILTAMGWQLRYLSTSLWAAAGQGGLYFSTDPTWMSHLDIDEPGILIRRIGVSGALFPRIQLFDDSPIKSIPFWLPFLILVNVWLVLRGFLWTGKPHIRPGHCERCNYDLMGNESGRWPECNAMNKSESIDSRVANR